MMRPAVPSIDVRDVARRLSADAPPDGMPAPLVVDVRNPDEFATARIEDAVLMPLPVFAQRFAELPADRELFLVCHSGNRSAAATAHLLRNGYEHVHNVTGGMVAWHGAGLPMRSGPPGPGEGDLQP